MATRTNRPDFSLWISVFGLVFLAFLIGVGFGVLKLFPFSALKDAHKALGALLDESRNVENKYQTNLWTEDATNSSSPRGVTTYDAEQAYNGVTLFTSAHAQQASLVDMQGRIVHEWNLPIAEIWNPDDPFGTPRITGDVSDLLFGRISQNKSGEAQFSDEKVYWRDAYLYPNGDLLALIVEYGVTPWGLALVRMNADSKLLWSYQKNVHHDIAVDSEGRIYTLTNAVIDAAPSGLGFLDAPMLDDRVNILGPDGKEVKEFSILKAIRDSEYAALLEGYRFSKKGDFLHTNTIDVLDPVLADKFPFAKAGDVMVCFRDANIIAIVDPEREVLVWAMRGPWHRPHDPDFLANGNILIFDNRGHLGPEGKSRVIEINPGSSEIVWSYAGTRVNPLNSRVRSRQQRLANGNTLITESDRGRLLEVTPAKKIVWEFINPVREEHNGEYYTPVVMGGLRYRLEDIPFLTPTGRKDTVLSEVIK